MAIESAARTDGYPQPSSPRWLSFVPLRRSIMGALVADRWERARILAYITGTADHELLLQHEYLLAEKVDRDGNRSTVKSSNSAT
jgi:hypothetical protein